MNCNTYLIRVFLSMFILFSLTIAHAQTHDNYRINTENSGFSRNAIQGKIGLSQFNALTQRLTQNQTVPIIVKFKQLRPHSVVSTNLSTILQTQSNFIKQQQDTIINRFDLGQIKSVKRFKYIPFLAMEVDRDVLTRLLRSDAILSISEDKINRLALDQSIPYIQGDLVWNEGYTGGGQSIAILDSGIDANHSFLVDPNSPTGESKVISEACYSTTLSSVNSTALCQDGDTTQGVATNCTEITGCDHGTHVAGIAAGNGDIFSGVARNASLISIQVFSRFDNEELCNSPNPCILSYTSDIIQGLERVYTLAINGTYDIASVNLSIGGELFSTALDCDNNNLSTKQAIDNLRSIGIATIIASGNDGNSNSFSAPGCISSAISVGATDNENNHANFSNGANWLSLLAPGSFILSSTPEDSFVFKTGTSMATPHVSGAFAVLKSKSPNATVDQILAALVNTGRTIVDPRNGFSKPRINLNSASKAFDSTLLPVNLILDNDFRGNQIQGTFNKITSNQSYNGTALIGDSNESNIFSFSPVLTQSGIYRIYGWWPALPSNTTQANFTINHDNDVSIIEVDQQKNGSQWYELGAFPLTINSPTSIKISDTNGTSAVVDAVRLEFLEGFQLDNILIDFNNSDLSSWTVIDQGNMGGPSNWLTDSGALVQNSNINSSLLEVGDIQNLGTHILYDLGFGWTDLRASFTLRTLDDDAIGVMFRYQDQNNYYRFSWDKERSYRRLVKRVNGIFTLLAEDNVPYVQGQTYQFHITTFGSTLNLRIDGETIFSVADSSLTSGTIAFYTWAQNSTFFDDLVVEQGTVAGENNLPMITDMSATPTILMDNETSQLAVNAIDTDTSPQALTYQWSIETGGGNLDNFTSSMPLYTPADVSSTESVTLRVIVSDGEDFVSQRIALTINDADALPVLLSENFESGSLLESWTIIDQGTRQGPSNWSTSNSGILSQFSNIHGGSFNLTDLTQQGTHIRYDFGFDWRDYQVNFIMRSQDNDSIGLLFRYQDENNYYRFSWDKQRSYRRLVKRENGVFTLLAEDNIPYTQSQNYQLKITASGSTLNVDIDGTTIFSEIDSSLTAGTIAFYTWAEVGGHFERLLVEDLE